MLHNPANSNQNYQKQGQFAPIISKQFSFKTIAFLKQIQGFWMPLAGFPPKIASTIEIRILLPKSTQEAPQGPLTPRMCKFGSIIFKHKNSDNSEAIGSSNSKRCSHQVCTIMQNFSPLPPAVQKLLAKRFIFNSFQDP